MLEAPVPIFFLMYSFYQRDMKSMDQVLCKMTAVQDRRSYASSSTLNFENVQRAYFKKQVA